MKIPVLILAMLFPVFMAFAQSEIAAEDVAISKSEKNFGTIRQGKPVTEIFFLINKGKEIIKIGNIYAECGCTTPVWSQEPIAPGDSLAIEIGYNAAVPGPFRKKVEIVVENLSQPIPVYISGNVYEAQATSAPVNASIVKLKSKNR